MNRRRGHSIEPTGTCGRAHIVGTVSVIAGVQGALLPPHRYSQHEVTESFVRFPGSVAFEDMARKRYASSKVLESIRATARLALTPPSANRAPFGAREPNPGAGPRAAPRRETSHPACQPGVIPSAPASEYRAGDPARASALANQGGRRHAELRYATRGAGIVNRRSAVDMGCPTTSARSPLQLCRFPRDRSRCRR